LDADRATWAGFLDRPDLPDFFGLRFRDVGTAAA
jgi:hypothetical protein